MIGLQLLVRGWSVYSAWFYSDDFIFLEDALKNDLTLSFLFRPHDSHLMPPGIALSWIVAHAGPFSWGLAATITIVLQLIASLACLWMLTTLFGTRLKVLVPLAFYLFSTMSLDGVMWWSAALNALPLHIAFFTAITASVAYFRRHSVVALLGAFGAFAFGLLADPRGLLIPVAVALLAVGFFATGTWWKRPWRALRVWWQLWTPLALLGVGYLALYRQVAPSPVTTEARTELVKSADSMIGTSYLTSLVGGPWHWDNSNPPMATVDPPTVLRLVAAMTIVAALGLALRRSPKATLAAGLILGVHLTVTLVGFAWGRATQIGPQAGLLMRFLADSASVTTLALALVAMPATGATVMPHDKRWGSYSRPARGLISAVLATAIVGALVSTVEYAKFWRDYPARTFVMNARDSLARDPATIADIPVPEIVQAATSFPHNLPSRLLYPIRDTVTTTDSGNDLHVLDSQGFHRPANVPAAISGPPGPQPNCGYPIDRAPTTIVLPSRNNAEFWWMSLSYISGGPSTIELRADGQVIEELAIEPGTHTYFLQGEKPFNSLTLRSLTGNTTCVDVINIGDKIVPAT